MRLRPPQDHDDSPGRRILRIVRETTDSPSIRGCDVRQKRDPASSRRFRNQERTAEPELSQSDLQGFLAEWLTFQRRVTSLLEGRNTTQSRDREDGPKKIARNYTPTEPPELKSPPKPPTYRPEITKGKLYFNCPACFHPTAVFAECAGKTTRCPRCFSAILAPDPESGSKGANLNNDIESILHPEEFIGVIPKRTRIGNVLPLPKLNTAMISLGVAIVVAAMIGAGSLMLRNQHDSPAPILITKEDTTPSFDVTSLQDRAEILVSDFLAARGWHAKSRFVRDRQRVAPLMEAYYRSGPSIDPDFAQLVKIEANKSGFYDHLPGETKYTLVKVRPHSGAAIDYIVEHHPDGDFIEWESSVGFNALPLGDILASTVDSKGATSQTLRVLASRDDYFNFRYNSERHYACVRIQDPRDPEFTGYAYVRRDGTEFPTLKRLLATSSTESPIPLMLKVALAPDASRTRQMEVVGVINDHWRNDSVRQEHAPFLVDGDTPPTPIE